MKSITIIADWFTPSNLATSIRFQPFVNALEDSKLFSITIYTDPSSKGVKFVKTNLIQSPKNSWGFLRRILWEFFLGIELFFKLLFLKTDLVIITSPPFFASYFAALSCKITSKKYIFDVRDIYPEVYSKAGILNEKGFIYKFLTALELFCYKNAVLITTVSPNLVADINTRSKSMKCILLRNGFSEKVFSVGLDKYDKFTLVFHGNIGRFQNPEYLTEVINETYKINPEINFIAIGDGPKDHILKNFNSPNFKFLGRLSNSEVASIISKCHLGLSFRTDDLISINSTPVKVFEYLGVGIPMLITPFESEGGILAENLGFGKKFHNNQAKAIALYIQELSSDTHKYEELRKNVMTYRPEFSREIQANKLLELIKVELKVS